MSNTDKQTSDLESLKFVNTSGEPLPKFHEEKFINLYGKEIFNGLGMGEVLTWATGQNNSHKKKFTIGKVLPGIEYEIRDENGNLCGNNQTGELYLKHPCAAIMYWNDYRASVSTFVNGWVKTKDMVYQDEDGFLVYVSRADDRVKIKGSYVSMIEIEEELLQHQQVNDCVVTCQEENNQLIIKADIVLNSDQNISVSDIREFLAGRLESYKIPKKVEFVPALNRTVTTKKIRNRAVKTI